MYTNNLHLISYVTMTLIICYEGSENPPTCVDDSSDQASAMCVNTE